MSYYLAGKTLQPIEAGVEKQKKFVADAAHELRTPLAVMKTGAETLLMDRANEKEYEKFTRDSLEEIDSLVALVNGLLFLARGDSLKKVEFEEIDIGLIAKKQAALMQEYAKSKQVDLEDDADGNCYIQGNKADVKRLLANLIKNAIDYNKPGGKVVVSLSAEKNQVVLKIADSGTGIAEKDLSRVFDRFYKVDAARAKTAGGAGLGLAISKEIVSKHGGKIEIKSKLGKGTEITTFFPSVFS
jgi:two-component system sensor histidine kinase CiaH